MQAVTGLGVAGVQLQPVQARSCSKHPACASRGMRASREAPSSPLPRTSSERLTALSAHACFRGVASVRAGTPALRGCPAGRRSTTCRNSGLISPTNGSLGGLRKTGEPRPTKTPWAACGSRTRGARIAGSQGLGSQVLTAVEGALRLSWRQIAIKEERSAYEGASRLQCDGEAR